jgi:hypothetical protein
MDYTQDLKKAYSTSVIFYIVFMLSLVIYLIVFSVLKARIPEFQGMMEKIDFPWLRIAFYGLGLVQIFLIKFIRETATKSLTTVDVQILTQHLQRVSMISAVLCEVPAMLGWVLFFLSGKSQDFYFLLIVSFFLFVIYFPRFSNWVEWVKSKTSH